LNDVQGGDIAILPDLVSSPHLNIGDAVHLGAADAKAETESILRERRDLWGHGGEPLPPGISGIGIVRPNITKLKPLQPSLTREFDIGQNGIQISPRCGRLVAFTSGAENPHLVTALRNGTRMAISGWFTQRKAHAGELFLGHGPVWLDLCFIMLPTWFLVATMWCISFARLRHNATYLLSTFAVIVSMHPRAFLGMVRNSLTI
jgi:hypothetical protein